MNISKFLHIIHQQMPSIKTVVLTLLLMAFGLYGVYAPITTVHAEPTSSSQLFLYCQEHVKSKARSGCSGEDGSGGLFEQARNVASYHCKDYETQASVDNGKREACITSQAEKYIASVADDNPSSGSAFKSQFKHKLEAVGGSTTHPKDVAGASDSQTPTSSGGNCDPSKKLCSSIQNGVDCSKVACSDPAADPKAKCGDDDNGYGCDLVKKYINPAINLFSAIFILIAIASIIAGGIQYSASEGDPQKVSKAKGRITSTIFAIVAYFFLYSFLQFIVPGGIFNRS